MIPRIDRRRFLGLLGLLIAEGLYGCGTKKAIPDFTTASHTDLPEAASLPFAFHGSDLEGWDVSQGGMVYAVEGQSAATEADIATAHMGSHSELQANVTRRSIMAHNITAKQVIDAQALSCIQTVSFIFRLPYAPSNQDADVNGQSIRIGLYGWDDATGLEKGTGLQWMLDPRLPSFGALATRTNDGSWFQIGWLDPDTIWHILQMQVNFPQGLASLQIDGQSYPVQVASWRSSVEGAVVGARLQMEAISLYPGADQKGALWALQIKDWSWSWEAQAGSSLHLTPVTWRS